MKIVKRSDLMEMDAPLLIAKVPSAGSDPLCLKMYGGKFASNDFLTMDLITIKGDGSDDCDHNWHALWEGSVSIPLGEPDSYGRDGLFDGDDGARYIIFEGDDLLQFRGYIDAAIATLEKER